MVKASNNNKLRTILPQTVKEAARELRQEASAAPSVNSGNAFSVKSDSVIERAFAQAGRSSGLFPASTAVPSNPSPVLDSSEVSDLDDFFGMVARGRENPEAVLGEINQKRDQAMGRLMRDMLATLNKSDDS